MSPFRRVAILGTGLIGGSFGLALRRASPDAKIIGWDRLEVLSRAVARGAIHIAAKDLSEAVRGADLVILALPIAAILDVLPLVARHAEPQALVTDTGSTKATICRAADLLFTNDTRFLGGHPIAGKERSGIENADADLFYGARWALIGLQSDPEPRVNQFASLLEAIGVHPVWLDAEAHDRALAIVSHLPQLAAVALASVVRMATDETGRSLTLAGPGLRDALRLAGSPYSVWRDICLTNRENISAALDQLIQALDELRTHLADRELEEDFRTANDLYESLRKLQ